MRTILFLLIMYSHSFPSTTLSPMCICAYGLNFFFFKFVDWIKCAGWLGRTSFRSVTGAGSCDMAEVSPCLFFSFSLSSSSSSPGSALRPFPRVLRGVSELEHVNKHSLNHCIERHTHAYCTGVKQYRLGVVVVVGGGHSGLALMNCINRIKMESLGKVLTASFWNVSMKI